MDTILKEFAQANEKRDFSIYTTYMDAALEAKARSIFPHFGQVESNAVIVDAGSGTGNLAELAAREFRGSNVYALDISHELREIAEENRSLINLVYGDASKQNFPNNSVDIKYYSTSGHEIESFGGAGKMKEALKNTYKELKPGGVLVIRDFAKPDRKNDIYMSILSTVGLDSIEEATVDGAIDYNLLSTKTLFTQFHREFKGGNVFSYEIIEDSGKKYIKISPEWAHEFYLRKDYTANWRQEIKEKYTFWSITQAKEEMENAGFKEIEIIPDPNPYILENRLIGKIALFDKDEKGKFLELSFPTTHMIVKGKKPKSIFMKIFSSKSKNIESAVDYEKLKNTVYPDIEKGIVTIDNRIFLISKYYPIIRGSKKIIYHIKENNIRILKTVRSDGLNDHAIFSAMYQSVAREKILDEFNIPHMRVLETDPQGPPYRYYVQECLPKGAVCATELIKSNTLNEKDIFQMAAYINLFELGKIWQLDTNPFNWYKVKTENGKTQMVYVDGKIYKFDEDWEFRRIGLLQWLDPKYTENLSVHSALIPKAKEYEKLKNEWESRKDKHSTWWKKYLNIFIQPITN